METLLTNKSASITELREAGKILDRAGSTPVAIFKRDEVVAYLVPVSAINNASDNTTANDDVVMAALNKRRKYIDPTLAYLKDK